jgi:Rad3-related DNA helicase
LEGDRASHPRVIEQGRELLATWREHIQQPREPKRNEFTRGERDDVARFDVDDRASPASVSHREPRRAHGCPFRRRRIVKQPAQRTELRRDPQQNASSAQREQRVCSRHGCDFHASSCRGVIAASASRSGSCAACVIEPPRLRCRE